MVTRATIVNWLLGLAGGIAGGVLGYFAFFVLTGQGIYAIVLPGALLGLGCGALSGEKSNGLGIVCGVAALALGVFVEWRFAPFIADESLGYFLAHLNELKTISLVLVAIGGILAFWFGKGRAGGVWLRHRPPAAQRR